MAGNLLQCLYRSTLHEDNCFSRVQTLSSCEKQILVDFHKLMRWEQIVYYLNKINSLSYLFFKGKWMDQLSSILLIQQMAKCDQSAKEFSRRGQQVFVNIERLLSISDRSLCQQFVNAFMNCANYDQLCSEEEVKAFWPSL